MTYYRDFRRALCRCSCDSALSKPAAPNTYTCMQDIQPWFFESGYAHWVDPHAARHKQATITTPQSVQSGHESLPLSSPKFAHTSSASSFELVLDIRAPPTMGRIMGHHKRLRWLEGGHLVCFFYCIMI